MRWIVKSDFLRTKQLKDVKIVDAIPGVSKTPPHENHFHTGAIIELGDIKTESELQTGNDDKKGLIATLRYAGRIGDASDKDVVARVTADVAIEKKRLETQAGRDKETKNSDVGAAVIAAISPEK